VWLDYESAISLSCQSTLHIMCIITPVSVNNPPGDAQPQGRQMRPSSSWTLHVRWLHSCPAARAPPPAHVTPLQTRPLPGPVQGPCTQGVREAGRSTQPPPPMGT
jgi:hypothetical protein